MLRPPVWVKWTLGDLNPRPLECHSSDLPADLSALFIQARLGEAGERSRSFKPLCPVTKDMGGGALGDRLTRYVTVTARATKVPSKPPVVPEGMLESITEKISVEEAPFLLHLARVRVEWLGLEADRLGNTHFEMHPHELEARKKQRLPPGPITIGIHPILAEDEMLFNHTLVHELLHAAGLTEHNNHHAELVNEIAPSPKLSESPLLQDIRNQALGQQEIKDWTCLHCGFVWERTTVRTPSRCPKCARPFK